MNEAPLPSAIKRRLSHRQRELLAIVLEGALLLGMIALVVNIWNSKHVTVTTHTVVVQASPRAGIGAVATPKVSAAPVASNMQTLSEALDPPAQGYKLSMLVPALWRAVDVKSLLPADAYADYTTDQLAAVLRFVPEFSERSTAAGALEPVNTMDVVADIGSHKCPAVGLEATACPTIKVRPQAVQSADGSMNGTAYLALAVSTSSYEPRAVVDLNGNVGGKPVRIVGVFRLYDQQYATLSINGVQAAPSAPDFAGKVTAARQAFAANPPADTLDMYSRVVAAVRSMRFDKK